MCTSFSGYCAMEDSFLCERLLDVLGILRVLPLPPNCNYVVSLFATFTGPSVTIFSVDYFFMRKGNVHIPSLYKGSSSSPYWYYGGFNIRAFVAWAIGVAIVINGFAGALEKDYDIGSKQLYSLDMLLSFATAGTLYYIFNLIWPVEIYPAERFDAPKSMEYMKATDCYFEDDDVIIGTDHSNGNNGITQMEREENVLNFLA